MKLQIKLIGAAGALVAMLAAGPAMADVKAGVDAWSRGDFTAAVSEWMGPAAQGDADAQFNMGQAYRLGRGVKADLARAEELFGKAAAQGHLHASDNYGLLLFQRGERAKALPYISAAADRGEPRAQYLLGIANFNGDNVPKDWVRAYALVSLAQQAGLAQAISALSQMDQYIPLEQRQKSVALAQELSSQAEATRARQLAAIDLGNSVPTGPLSPVVTSQPRVPPTVAVAVPAPVPAANPRTAGADYSRPRSTAPAPPVAVPPRPPVAVAAPRPASAMPAPKPTPVAVAPRGAFAPSGSGRRCMAGSTGCIRRSGKCRGDVGPGQRSSRDCRSRQASGPGRPGNQASGRRLRQPVSCAVSLRQAGSSGVCLSCRAKLNQSGKAQASCYCDPFSV